MTAADSQRRRASDQWPSILMRLTLAFVAVCASALIAYLTFTSNQRVAVVSQVNSHEARLAVLEVQGLARQSAIVSLGTGQEKILDRLGAIEQRLAAIEQRLPYQRTENR